MKIIAITPNQKHDFLAESVIEGLNKLNIQIIATDSGNGIKQIYSDDEILEHAQDANYILAIWGKFTKERPAKYYLLDKIKKPEKTIFIDGAEWTYSGHRDYIEQAEESLVNPSRRRGYPWIWEWMHDRVKWHFKRECYPTDVEKYNCIPLPFAGIDSYQYPIKNKSIDLFCAFGHHSTGLRVEAEEIIQKYQNRGNFIVGKIPKDKYLNIMSSALSIVDAWGGGDCNARFFEGLANRACMIYQKWNIIMPYPFIDGKNIIEYSTKNELEEKIDYYFPKNINKIRDMSIKSYEHYFKYHTAERRVKYMFNIIENEK